jgi:hypothetical protein
MDWIGRALLLLAFVVGGWLVVAWVTPLEGPPDDLKFWVFIGVALWLFVLEPWLNRRKQAT